MNRYLPDGRHVAIDLVPRDGMASWATAATLDGRPFRCLISYGYGDGEFPSVTIARVSDDSPPEDHFEPFTLSETEAVYYRAALKEWRDRPGRLTRKAALRNVSSSNAEWTRLNGSAVDASEIPGTHVAREKVLRVKLDSAIRHAMDLGIEEEDIVTAMLS